MIHIHHLCRVTKNTQFLQTSYFVGDPSNDNEVLDAKSCLELMDSDTEVGLQ